METKTDTNISETVTVAQALEKFPKIKKGFDELNWNYRNWLKQYMSPSLFINKYLEIENANTIMGSKFGPMINQNRISVECSTLRWAVELITGTNRFFEHEPVPANRWKTTASAPEDQYLLDLLQLSYPMARGFESLKPEEQAWVRSKFAVEDLNKAFIYGVQAYAEGRLKSSGQFANVNSAQLAYGIWGIHGVWVGSIENPV